MKRTPLKRTATLKRGPAPKRKTPLKAKRSKSRRVAVTRDPEYLKWIRKQLCLICCSMNPSDAAHTTVNGRSSKGDDSRCIPLCRFHHVEQHNIGWPEFERKYRIDRSEQADFYYCKYATAFFKKQSAAILRSMGL